MSYEINLSKCAGMYRQNYKIVLRDTKEVLIRRKIQHGKEQKDLILQKL